MNRFLVLILTLVVSVVGQGSWTLISPAPTNNNLNSISWSDSVIIIVGDSGTILSSPDGAQWTKRDSKTTNSLSSVAWTGKKFVAVGKQGTILNSSDGIIWYSTTSLTTDWLRGVTWSGYFLVIVSDSGWIITSDANALSIHKSKSGVGLNLRLFNVASDVSGNIVAIGQHDTTHLVGDESKTIISTDGASSWTLYNGCGSYLNIAWTNNCWTEVCFNGPQSLLYTSTDAINWNSFAPQPLHYISSITANGLTDVAVGDSGRVYTINYPYVSWTTQTTATNNLLLNVAFTGEQFIAIGVNGTIIRSVTVTSPATPVLVSPASGAVAQPVSLSLVWNKVSTAKNYYVQVATDAGFTSLFTQDSTLTDTLKAISGLANSTVYYWRVKAKNIGGSSAWASYRSFTTAALPATPVLVSPANGDTNQSVTSTLSWSTVSGATSYYMQVATDTGFTSMFMQDSTLTDTLKRIILDSNTTYYWRVSAKNVDGTSAWSEVRNFRTGTTAVLPYRLSLPHTFSITGSSGMVRYGLPVRCHVSLKYYDLRGRLVATLVNSTQSVGDYALSVRAAISSSCLYIRIFEAGSFVKREIVAMVGK